MNLILLEGKPMKKIKNAFITAFPYTLPIMAGFFVLGTSYGFLMSSLGFPFYYPLLMSILIFAGAMQFVTVDLLLTSFDPFAAFFLTLLVNARHLFYGISLLEDYRVAGPKKYYLIYSLCDETFSVNSTVTLADDVDKDWFMFFVSLLNQSYWVIASTLGGVLGTILNFDIKGLDFVLTALFVVLFVDQWLKTTDHKPAVWGLSIASICLLICGSEYFMIVTMSVCIAVFYFTYKKEKTK